MEVILWIEKWFGKWLFLAMLLFSACFFAIFATNNDVLALFFSVFYFVWAVNRFHKFFPEDSRG